MAVTRTTGFCWWDNLNSQTLAVFDLETFDAQPYIPTSQMEAMWSARWP